MACDSLIVNADDFGLTRAVSDAVIEVHKNGSATSASLMSTMPAADYAADLALRNPALGVGLHFTLTEGFAAKGAKSRLAATPDGRFFGRNALMARVAAGLISAADIHEELDAQFAALRALGVEPTHIDGHQHVHVFPTIFKIVAEFAAARKLPVRLPYTQAVCLGPDSFGPRFVYREAKHRLLASVIRCCESLRKGPGNRSFNSIFDIYPFHPAKPAHYQELIRRRRGSPHELMVHPYILSEELRQIYSDPEWFRVKSIFFAKCEAEYLALRSFSIRDWVANAAPGVRLTTYREIAAASSA